MHIATRLPDRLAPKSNLEEMEPAGEFSTLIPKERQAEPYLANTRSREVS